MKTRTKKIMSLFLTAAILTGTVMGCGGKEKEEANGAESTNNEEAVTISMVMKDMSPDDEVSVKFLEAVSKGVSEQLGKEIKIELEPISEGSYSESMGLLIQSGKIPDLMYFQGGDYQFAITQEILEDLTPYIESSTYIKSMMQPYNEERIKNYPYLLWLSPDRIPVPLVRKDWFEATESGKTLLENPTVENYKIFFQELKEKNNLKEAFTMTGDNSEVLLELDTIFNQAFGITKTWEKEGDAYVYNKVSAKQKEKLAFYAELYTEGLLDNEWLSKKWDTKESAFYNGEVGVISGTQGSVINVYNNKMTTQNGDEAELMVLPPAKGESQGYVSSDTSKESRGWAISAYSEHKEEAFAILEYMASPEGQVLDKLGYEGEQYNIEDGKYVLTDKSAEWWPRFHESLKGFEAEFSEETPYYTEAATRSLEMTEEYGSLDNKFILPDEYVTSWDACEALYKEYVADVISGKKSIDTFDEFVKEWNDLGGKEVTEYANEVLNK